ncbi:uncharacterized protein LOC119554670 [Drosophila subpulchrella]|uniref:uncharacterized protein LOC119554670 n=1 Tax=Drosophila subpulchrella TaxID=1486046 RepID=UPI0018A162DE|nr:uncharacterized protein LOC119554670 [Drosophila subpulchrella]
MGMDSILLLGILATIVFSDIFASQPGPCRKLVQTYNATTIKGKMIHRSLYLDVFATRKSKAKPLNLCIRVNFPNSKQQNSTVIGTDNKEFLVLYRCTYFPTANRSSEFVNTYTRLKTPSAATLSKISEAYKKNGLQESQVLALCQ